MNLFNNKLITILLMIVFIMGIGFLFGLIVHKVLLTEKCDCPQYFPDTKLGIGDE